MYCLIQVHALCVNMTDSTFKDSWRCEKCIHISDNILELIQDMKYVLRDIHDLKVSIVDVKGHLNFLQEKLESTNKELEFLRETNNDLVKQLDTNNELLTTLKNENIQLKDELKKMQLPQQTTNSMNRQQTEPKPALVIGDSMVRNLHSADQKHLMIRTYSGAKMSIIKEKLNLYARDNKYFSSVYIVAGTNDCSVTSINTDRITEDTLQTLETACKIADKVYLSSILPRTDNGEAQLKSENTNTRLRQLCPRMSKVTFVDHDRNFRLSDNSINDAYSDRDGLHLNQSGCDRLVKNLKINATFRDRRSYYRTSNKTFSSAQDTNFLVVTSVPPANERTWRQNHNSVEINYQNGDLPSYRQKSIMIL